MSALPTRLSRRITAAPVHLPFLNHKARKLGHLDEDGWVMPQCVFNVYNYSLAGLRGLNTTSVVYAFLSKEDFRTASFADDHGLPRPLF